MKLTHTISAALVLLNLAGLSHGAQGESLVPDMNTAYAQQTPAPASNDQTATQEALAKPGNFICSQTSIMPEGTIGWEGFIHGLKGFDHFYAPVGQPLYFETPFNRTELRALFLHHEFSQDSALRGGDLNVYALQIRLALTERLGFIATKDGYSDFNSNLLPDDTGWNDLALGLKYVLIADQENDFVLTPGCRFQLTTGEASVLQGHAGEASPFISVAKGWDKFHLVGNVTGRIPFESENNTLLQWDIHADYELFRGFAPLVELHALHYLDNGTRNAGLGNAVNLPVGGLDYANLGSSDVSGKTVVWLGAGGRFKFTPNISLGATYEFALTNKNADIMDNRVTVDLIFTW